MVVCSLLLNAVLVLVVHFPFSSRLVRYKIYIESGAEDDPSIWESIFCSLVKIHEYSNIHVTSETRDCRIQTPTEPTL